MMRVRLLLPKLLRFAIVGIIVAGVFMGLNWLLAPAVGKQAAFLLSYPPALAVHFWLNKWWTFASRGGATRRQIGEYLVMVAITFLLQWAVFNALSRWTRLPGWLEAGLANVAQTAISFLFMQARIFGAPRKA
jgi:putative flippase GtrA